MKLLIADDDPTFRLILTNLAVKWGFEPTATEDGGAAWELLQEDHSPRLILLDWEMPQLNGLELCKRIREMPSEDPPSEDPPYIILLTSRQDSVDVANGLESGANDYIRKPFEPVELKARLQAGRRMLDLQAEASEIRAQLTHQANYDGLTGLPNRRSVMTTLDREIDRANRQQIPLAVGMCDIDHFKKINDTHGHLVGDAVLREVAQRINTTLRSYDTCGRYGGEEFLVLINSAKKEATDVFNRLRQAVEGAPIIVEGISCSVTVSCGVAFVNREILSGSNVLAAADTALYEAKSAGRNRIVFAQDAALIATDKSLETLE